MKIKAIRTFAYKGAHVAVGDVIEVNDKDEYVLIGMKKAVAYKGAAKKETKKDVKK